MTIEEIAKVCHEMNRVYCERIGDHSQKPWDDAEPWQRASAIAGVRWRLENPSAPASAQHEAWVLEKLEAGWKFGHVKDPARKEHPYMVPYNELPFEQKVKDWLFVDVVRVLTSAVVSK